MHSTSKYTLGTCAARSFRRIPMKFISAGFLRVLTTPTLESLQSWMFWCQPNDPQPQEVWLNLKLSMSQLDHHSIHKSDQFRSGFELMDQCVEMFVGRSPRKTNRDSRCFWKRPPVLHQVPLFHTKRCGPLISFVLTLESEIGKRITIVDTPYQTVKRWW